MKLYTTVILLLLALTLCVIPAPGQEKYQGGAPEISAYISGTNEYAPRSQ